MHNCLFLSLAILLLLKWQLFVLRKQSHSFIFKTLYLAWEIRKPWVYTWVGILRVVCLGWLAGWLAAIHRTTSNGNQLCCFPVLPYLIKKPKKTKHSLKGDYRANQKSRGRNQNRFIDIKSWLLARVLMRRIWGRGRRVRIVRETRLRAASIDPDRSWLRCQDSFPCLLLLLLLLCPHMTSSSSVWLPRYLIIQQRRSILVFEINLNCISFPLLLLEMTWLCA